MNSPQVSIIIPVYNAEKYIRQTVQSALCQTYRDFEIIILNDGSTDHSSEIIRQLQKEDDRIQVIDKPNTGVSDTRNLGISLAMGKYLAFLDADDLWKPDNLQRKIETMQATGKKWIFSNMEIIDDNNAPVARTPKILSTNRLLDRLLLWETGDDIPGPCSNIIAEKELFDSGIKFDIHLSSPADRDICVQLAAKAEPAMVDEILWQYRFHTQNMTSTNRKVAGEVIYYIKKIERSGLFASKKQKHRVISNLYLMLSGICFRFLHQNIKGLNFLGRSIVWSPGNVWKKKIKPILHFK
jgi:glycosyltransferase involved in cell wall biosynthesis